MPTHHRSPSIYSVSDDESDDYAPSPDRKPASSKRKRAAPIAKSKSKATTAGVPEGVNDAVDIEDVPYRVCRTHGEEYHDVENIVAYQGDLLQWFEGVREKRGMPWRKKYDPTLSVEEKGQRAYEIWVSEVMLQQTQVSTVIAYWQKWIVKWPTIVDLAKADIEEVNAAWRGLGYYRRAKSLLEGAKTVMSSPKYHARLPDDPIVLEKEIAGIGRYTAGAICSMAYGIRSPLLDGNVHRLLTRLLAFHSPQTSPATIKFLWSAAEKLVDHLNKGDKSSGIAGDWNQAMMELGSQVCKHASPDCGACPMKGGCKAYAELTNPPPKPINTETVCKSCAPISGEETSARIPTVMVFPMKKEKKASRVEEESVCVVEWRGNLGERKWLFVKRPEKGLLAGLFEPPTTPVSSGLTSTERFAVSVEALVKHISLSTEEEEIARTSGKDMSSITHIFSHINMTYHIHHLIISSPSSLPPAIRLPTPRPTVWLSEEEVEGANVGTGVKKVWAEVYGSWGGFELSGTAKKRKVPAKRTTAKKAVPSDAKTGKVVRKVFMPGMPVRKASAVE